MSRELNMSASAGPRDLVRKLDGFLYELRECQTVAGRLGLARKAEAIQATAKALGHLEELEVEASIAVRIAERSALDLAPEPVRGRPSNKDFHENLYGEEVPEDVAKDLASRIVQLRHAHGGVTDSQAHDLYRQAREQRKPLARRAFLAFRAPPARPQADAGGQYRFSEEPKPKPRPKGYVAPVQEDMYDGSGHEVTDPREREMSVERRSGGKLPEAPTEEEDDAALPEKVRQGLRNGRIQARFTAAVKEMISAALACEKANLVLPGDKVWDGFMMAATTFQCEFRWPEHWEREGKGDGQAPGPEAG